MSKQSGTHWSARTIKVLSSSNAGPVILTGTSSTVVGLRVPAGKWLVTAKMWGDKAPGPSTEYTGAECWLVRGTANLDHSEFYLANTLGNTAADVIYLSAVVSLPTPLRVTVSCAGFGATETQMHDAKISAVGIPRGVAGTKTTFRSAHQAARADISASTVVASLRLAAGQWALGAKLWGEGEQDGSATSGVACDLVAGDSTVDHSEFMTYIEFTSETVQLSALVRLSTPTTVEVVCSPSGGRTEIDNTVITGFGVPFGGKGTRTKLLGTAAAGPVALAHPPGSTTAATLSIPAGTWLLLGKLWGTGVAGSSNPNTVVRCGLLDGSNVVDTSVFNAERAANGSGVVNLSAITSSRSPTAISIKCDDIYSNAQVQDMQLMALGVH